MLVRLGEGFEDGVVVDRGEVEVDLDLAEARGLHLVGQMALHVPLALDTLVLGEQVHLNRGGRRVGARVPGKGSGSGSG